MLSSFRQMLVLSAHPDDAEIGCGGTIARFRDAGVSVLNYIATCGEKFTGGSFPFEVREKEAEAAADSLGMLIVHERLPHRQLSEARQYLLERLCKIRDSYCPDMVILPSSTDIHQDHRVIHEEGIRAFKGVTVLGYEMLWNNMTFHSQAFVPLLEEHIAKKIKALSCYVTQAERGYLGAPFTKALAEARGMQIKVKYAEAFEVLRWVL